MWDEFADIHFGSKYYDVDSFRSGRITLRSTELEELGNLAGKSVLHLQCHFGMDSMSLARLGASVVGVDFSGRAIELATCLASELNIPARFICSNVYDLANRKGAAPLEEEFDIVFTSNGVLCWLDDLRAWAKAIATFLKPGGLFYITDLHPISNVFEYENDCLVVKNPYFCPSEPLSFDEDGSYADRNAQLKNRTSYEWSHSLSEIVTSLIDVGLTIEHLHEFPFCMYQRFNNLVQCEDGLWRFPPGSAIADLPLLFSLSARKK
jgi:SAM-dependent methyltransferase